MFLDGFLFTGFLEGLGEFLLKLAEGFNMVCYYVFQNEFINQCKRIKEMIKH